MFLLLGGLVMPSIQPIECRTFDLSGCDVTRIAFNYSIGMIVADERNSLSITIEAALTATLRPDKQVVMVDPQNNNPQSAALLLSFLHQPAKAIHTYSNGDLRLEMSNGSTIEVKRDEQYESWELSGAGSFQHIQMACTPDPTPPWGEP
ncbi:MAG: hypothetical protein C5B53_07460 [Candidatus Melainabacteria bacterium]|nr:MAG: hypothetical protein C5B53_07460 [Candidatus Melainabacteria bacterium]